MMLTLLIPLIFKNVQEITNYGYYFLQKVYTLVVRFWVLFPLEHIASTDVKFQKRNLKVWHHRHVCNCYCIYISNEIFAYIY